MEGHRRTEQGSAPIVRGIPIQVLIGALLIGAFSAGGIMWQIGETRAQVEKLDAKLDNRLGQMDEALRRQNTEMQEQKVKFAEFKGEVSAFISSRRPPAQQQ